MANKIIVKALNTPRSHNTKGREHLWCWAELILLYEDGTWEKIFEYQWIKAWDTHCFNTEVLKGRTREKAISIISAAESAGEIEGILTI